MAARDYDDTAHGPAHKPMGSAAKYDSSRSDSAMETGTILGKHGSQAPLVQVEHTGTEGFPGSDLRNLVSCPTKLNGAADVRLLQTSGTTQLVTLRPSSARQQVWLQLLLNITCMA